MDILDTLVPDSNASSVEPVNWGPHRDQVVDIGVAVVLACVRTLLQVREDGSKISENT